MEIRNADMHPANTPLPHPTGCFWPPVGNANVFVQHLLSARQLKALYIYNTNNNNEEQMIKTIIPKVDGTSNDCKQAAKMTQNKNYKAEKKQ